MIDTDYQVYKLHGRAYGLYGSVYIIAAIVVGLLFYNSWVAVGIFAMGIPLFFIAVKKKLCQKRLIQLKLDFRELMTVMYSMINAGYSLETAIVQAPESLRLCCQPDSCLLKELDYIIQKMKMNYRVIGLLEDFARRSQDSDIENFYQIIHIAQQYGGSMSRIIHTSIGKINERIEVQCELETMISGKKHEFMIMMVIPIGIMAYMRLGSGEMMAVLYTTILGRIIMTIALAIYGAAVVWGQKIVHIHI